MTDALSASLVIGYPIGRNYNDKLDKPFPCFYRNEYGLYLSVAHGSSDESTRLSSLQWTNTGNAPCLPVCWVWCYSAKKLVYSYHIHLRVAAKLSAAKASTRDVNWKKCIYWQMGAQHRISLFKWCVHSCNWYHFSSDRVFPMSGRSFPRSNME